MEAKTIQKYRDKSHPWMLKKAQELTNKFVRLRDSRPINIPYNFRWFRCIACGVSKSTKQMQAGHLHSAGSYSVLRYNLDNINGECKYCNYYSKDHLRQYTVNLIKKIGQEKVDKLQFWADASKQKAHKWDRFDLIDIIEQRKADITLTKMRKEEDKYTKCPKCGSKMALMGGYCVMSADEEPYADGERKQVDLDYPVNIKAYYCEKCERFENEEIERTYE